MKPSPSLPTAHCPLPTFRSGISLLEVLISMFVLLFGLMGVAAIFPVGNYYAGRGEQYDRGAAMADMAFAELKARGMLQPSFWLYPYMPTGAYQVTENLVIQPTPQTGPTPSTGSFNVQGAAGPGYAFVLDPTAIAASRANLTNVDVFPASLFNDSRLAGPNPAGGNYQSPQSIATGNWWERNGTPPLTLKGNRWPIRRITLPSDNAAKPTMSPAVASSMFRLRDDLSVELPEEGDRPGMQRWRTADIDPNTGDQNNTPDDPTDDTPLSRQFSGNYSWIATIVPTTSRGRDALQPVHYLYGTELYEVSVAVFYKREVALLADSERAMQASLNPGGELVLHAVDSFDGVDAVDKAVDGIRPGQWIALAGVHPTTGQFLLKWYRLLSLDDETQQGQRLVGTAGGPTYALRRAMVEGPDWPAAAGATAITNLRAILMPGIIGVSTQTMPIGDRSLQNQNAAIPARSAIPGPISLY